MMPSPYSGFPLYITDSIKLERMVYLYDLSCGFQPQTEVVDCKP
jgi:hypothetical protein